MSVNLGKKLNEELSDINEEITTITAEIRNLQKRKNELIEKKQQLERRIQDRNTALSEDYSSWEADTFPWSAEAKKVLKNVFKLDDFRPLQKSVINVVLSGEDCLIIMSTGGGKSLCYQLPAILKKGITLVVSPLVSLIQDQIMQLKKLEIEAVTLNQHTPKEEVKRIQMALTDEASNLRLVYVTPEKLAKSKLFMSKLEKCAEAKRLKLIAIDEVHCVSQWGNDFRPDYQFLHILKKQFKNVPLLGLTATATANVLADVKSVLGIQSSIVLRAGFNRENLFYEVRLKPSSAKDTLNDLVKLINGKFKGQSGIIYCFSRKECEDLAAELRSKQIQAGYYHAYMEPEKRLKCHEKWISGKIHIIVATVAFGMGIDKPDVRFVIHHSLSKSMENYYQESGRAGRDGKPAHCILYYRFTDVFRVSTMVATEKTGTQNLYSVLAYATTANSCRRVIIAQFFDETWDESWCNNMCDNCASNNVKTSKNDNDIDLSKYITMAKEIIETQSSNDKGSGRITAPKLAELMDKKLSSISREGIEKILATLLLQGFIQEDFHFTPYAIISYITVGARAKYGSGGASSSSAIQSNSKNSNKDSKKRNGNQQPSSSNTSIKKSKNEPSVIELI
uniref:ATP-dependent DNA helicase n=1 Tax=Panagrolaimus superbus TaxID=310955 RepID=A0A914YYJ4_9BILA